MGMHDKSKERKEQARGKGRGPQGEQRDRTPEPVGHGPGASDMMDPQERRRMEERMRHQGDSSLMEDDDTIEGRMGEFDH